MLSPECFKLHSAVSMHPPNEVVEINVYLTTFDKGLQW